MTHRPPLISTYFTVDGEGFDPLAFTELVGLTPTEVHTKRRVTGTLVDSGEPYVLHPSWWLKRTKEPRYSTDEGLRAVLDVLWPKRALIHEVVKRQGLKAQFGTTVTIEEDSPEFSVESDTLKRLAFFDCDYLLDVIY